MEFIAARVGNDRQRRDADSQRMRQASGVGLNGAGASEPGVGVVMGRSCSRDVEGDGGQDT